MLKMRLWYRSYFDIEDCLRSPSFTLLERERESLSTSVLDSCNWYLFQKVSAVPSLCSADYDDAGTGSLLSNYMCPAGMAACWSFAPWLTFCLSHSRRPISAGDRKCCWQASLYVLVAVSVAVRWGPSRSNARKSAKVALVWPCAIARAHALSTNKQKKTKCNTSNVLENPTR